MVAKADVDSIVQCQAKTLETNEAKFMSGSSFFFCEVLENVRGHYVAEAGVGIGDGVIISIEFTLLESYESIQESILEDSGDPRRASYQRGQTLYQQLPTRSAQFNFHLLILLKPPIDFSTNLTISRSHLSLADRLAVPRCWIDRELLPSILSRIVSGWEALYRFEEYMRPNANDESPADQSLTLSSDSTSDTAFHFEVARTDNRRTEARRWANIKHLTVYLVHRIYLSHFSPSLSHLMNILESTKIKLNSPTSTRHRFPVSSMKSRKQELLPWSSCLLRARN